MREDRDDENFSERLPPQTDFLAFAALSSYRPVPQAWRVGVADVRDSTGALRAGRYRDASLLSAAVIGAALNAVRPLQIPYRFGGTAQCCASLLGACCAEGQIFFGTYRATDLVATCLVETYQQRHQHFIDTASGGFSRAAALKAQARGLTPSASDSAPPPGSPRALEAGRPRRFQTGLQRQGWG